MNEAIYRLADSGGSVRIVIQKKPTGDYIVGISNGKDKPLICQGEQAQVDAEFDAALPGYLEALKTAVIEAKLKAAAEPDESEESDDKADHFYEPELAVSREKKNEQPELDFGF